MNKDKEREVKLAFYECEKEMRPIMDYLTEHQKEVPNYKGWVWLQGRLMYQPEILFVGFNPGQGKDWNCDFKLPFTGERQLTFFEDNNAYWNVNRLEDTHWWEKNKDNRLHSFAWQTLDILDKVAFDVYHEKVMDGKSIPRWGRDPKNENTLGGKITFINLYPIATEKEDKLGQILTRLKNKNCFEDENANFGKNWFRKLFFINNLKSLIKVMEPKLIVCMGTATYQDFTGDERQTECKKSIYYDSNKPEYRNVIGFDRSGTWNTEEIATGISNLLKELGPSKFD